MTEFRDTSHCLEYVEKTIGSTEHSQVTPSCFLQHRVDVLRESIVPRGQIACPRYDSHFNFRIKDGVDFPIESFAANPFFSYGGDFLNSKRHGAGVITMNDGSSISGKFVDGELTGPGIHTWADGSTYQGELLKGEAHGQGIYVQARGGVSYEGSFRFGLFHGKGVWKQYGDETYVGEFCDQMKQGEGTWTRRGEFQYCGTFLKDVPHGKGTMSFTASGVAYTGDFLEGAPHGTGTLTSDRITYEGPFRRGARFVIPSAILPVTVRVRDVSISNYIQCGLSPFPTFFHAGMSRIDKELALAQDPYIHVHWGTAISVTISQGSFDDEWLGIIESMSGDGQLEGQKSKLPIDPKGAPRKSRAKSISVAAPRSQHIVEELCQRAAQLVQQNETGRKVFASFIRVPCGEEPFGFDKYQDDATKEGMYLEEVSSDTITSAIGEFLIPKNEGKSATRTPRGGSKPTTSRGSVLSKVERISDEGTSTETLDANTTTKIEKYFTRGQCSFLIRVPPRAVPGEYVVSFESDDTQLLLRPTDTSSSFCTLRDLRIPVRIVPMDFQLQKLYTTAFLSGGTMEKEEVQTEDRALEENENECEAALPTNDVEDENDDSQDEDS